MTQPIRRRRPQAQGFTLIEVSLALIVFMMMTMIFAAVFPVVLRAGQMDGNSAQAAVIAQHKIDQLRGAGFDGINPAGQKFQNLPALGFVDTPATMPTGLPYTLSFTNADHLVPNGTTNGYFPAGTVGQITVTDYSTIDSTMASVSGSAGKVLQVTVTITWPVPTQAPVAGQPSINGHGTGTYSTSALIVTGHQN